MVLDFPDSPVLDQVWDAPSGSSYQYDGVVWFSLSGGGGGGGTVPPGGGLVTVSHDASLVGNGTSTTPLGVSNTYLDGVISNSIIDATGYTTTAMASRAAAQSNRPPRDVLLSRIDALEAEISNLKGRGKRPLSPVARAASRASRRRAPKE